MVTPHEPDDDDPGWPFGWRVLAGLMVPGFGLRRARRTAKSDGLVALRQIFVSFCVALVLFQIVLLAMGDDPADPGPNVAAAVAFLVVGAISAFVFAPLGKYVARSTAKAMPRWPTVTEHGSSSRSRSPRWPPYLPLSPTS